MGVVAGGAARCPSSDAEMYGSNTPGIAQVSALGSSEVSAPQRFKCINTRRMQRIVGSLRNCTR